MNPQNKGEEISQDLPTKKVAPIKEKIGILTLGILVKSFIFGYFFDYLLYPFVIWKKGLIKGGLMMTVLAGLVYYLLLIFYDWSRRDWLGIEAIKGLKDYNGNSKIRRFTSWILRKSDIVVLLFLSIKYDAFIITAYMRHGNHQYNGLARRDWKIFFSSLIISNIYWSLAAFMGVSVVEYVWQNFF